MNMMNHRYTDNFLTTLNIVLLLFTSEKGIFLTWRGHEHDFQ